MFNTIIVGVDGRQGGRDALALAERLRTVTDARLVAVSAFPYEFYVNRGSSAGFESLLRDDARAELTAELTRSGVMAEPEVVPDNSPARALHDAAERHAGDLIVVGSAHHGRFGRVLAGDVGSATLHGSPCPVIVAPSGYAANVVPWAAIGAAFDGWAESRAAVELAHALAKAAGLPLRVLSVLEPSVATASYPSSVHDWSGERDAVRAAMGERLAKLASELDGDVSTEMLEGEPARELIFEGTGLGLMVCGSRAYGPLRRLLVGSTARQLMHEAPFPVLVLPRGATEVPGRDEAAALTGAAHAS